MNDQLTDITLVVDRSGSMQEIRSDAQGGIDAFIRDQAGQSGDALMTLVQFDTDYEFVHRGVPIKQVPEYQLVPRGGTALLDAVGRAINETGARLSAMPEQSRPGLVIFVIVTDGEENSSREFTRDQVREMIQHQQSVYQWQFTFLAANAEAFAEAGGMGVDMGGAAMHAKSKMRAAYSVTSAKVARMRQQKAVGETVDNAFTEAERLKMEE